MTLWDDELEGYREQAREMLQFLPATEPTPPASGETRSEDLLGHAERAREGFADMVGQIPASERAEEISIPGPAGEIPCRFFRPDGPVRALYLHLHGGGWILGEPIMGDAHNAHLAQDYGMAVLSVDYRLAPEHPYPAGPDDCEAAARWLLEKGRSEFGAEKMMIGGESAGGHLTLVTALRVRDRLQALDRLLGLNLVFGWYDLNGTPSQYGNGGHPDMLSPDGLKTMVECFTPGLSEAERRAPDISPLFADLAGLPPSLISVGTLDHLRDDSLFLAPLLNLAGVETQLEVYPDSPHGYQSLPTKMAEASNRRMDAWIEAVMKGAGV